MTAVLVRSAASLAAGVALYFAFPPTGLWWLAPVGIGVLFAVLALPDRIRLRAGFGYGLLTGLGQFVPLLKWIDSMVGALPWIGLAIACSVFYGAFGLMATRLVRAPGAPVWTAAAFTVAEWARSSFPFGGFPWGRLAFSQGDSPLVSLARFVGAPGLSFAVALLGTAFAAAAMTARRRRSARGLLVPAAAAVIVVAAAAAAWPAVGAPSDGRTVTVAAIQGNVPEQRWDVATQREAVLTNHLTETARLAAEVRAGRQPQPDVVVWPENSSDVSPERDPEVAARMRAAAADVGAPILVGSVHYDDTGRYYNSMILMTPDGPIERHDKAILQPFGETMPMREFFRLFSSYVDLANDFTPGTGDGVVRPSRNGGPPVFLGVATCYEVAFDRSLRMSVDNGAQLLTVPTNNATFGRTGMTWQQLGMSQVRAVELDRDVMVAATTGVSAFVRPDGTIAQNTSIWTSDHLVETVALRNGRTPAARLGEWGNIALLVLTLCGIALAIRQDGWRLNQPASDRPEADRGTT
ncbi:apolipoprotein N-acyltransferase [Tsukamurella paurometabola]|uniref:Apolipoprotein N-acyltransferase n=1 Tax=Tsukamurella paurometabola (strain ATCC 8368 / DSM 20162 / CCUG 35730 / CIP 100753 / JCM 10117 / KCTC 9821 / NBRC 16120 / NCIMB 702349 / NCTC 13040) TaxID=521096 RepID=D5UPQ2_TSUPD|nr:apolipoprotein N-acyltransferase [Tsukamurella paurometabola]ADG78808.1 apolipoprotein N-acyltransferase [Tsukamurella paurometabola DSM 20162]SUP33207.1 Apolipoprotein N-acyltransferase [Tsukamurella paurometabola]